MDLFHMFRPLGIACLTLIMVGVAGCADVKRVMRYGVENMPSEQRPHWPSSPEKPRYAYSGQLIGWENFPVIQEKTREAGEQALIWLTGLDPETGLGHREDPKTGLQRPQTGVTDETGRIYVTDSGQNAVMVFDPTEPEVYETKFWKEDWSATPCRNCTDEIPGNAPVPRAKGFTMRAFVDLDHAGVVLALVLLSCSILHQSIGTQRRKQAAKCPLLVQSLLL